MREEQRAWIEGLGWDYTRIQKILVSFMNQKLLPGYVAVREKEAVGYTYFLMNKSKGIIGNIFVRNADDSRDIADRLLSMSISGLLELPRIRRVEAQIMPSNDFDFSDTFIRNGFRYYPRCYLNLDLKAYSKQRNSYFKGNIVPWDSFYLPQAAVIVLESYENQSDACICSDYRTASGCESYLRSITDNPGCGIFMPESSFLALDEIGIPCAFILGCRISEGIGMIPQVAVRPGYQGKNLGNAVMDRCLESFRNLGFQRAALTVTHENRKAYEWYHRLGFRLDREFGAFTWDR